MRNLPQTIRRAATPTSAVASTMQGDLPPSSSVTGTRFGAAAARTLRPTAAPPVKKIVSNGSAVSAAATSGPPVATATASGSRTSTSRAASHAALAGARSEGLSTMQLPAAKADTSGTSASWTG